MVRGRQLTSVEELASNVIELPPEKGRIYGDIQCGKATVKAVSGFQWALIGRRFTSTRAVAVRHAIRMNEMLGG